jgi:hypothetical protein
LNGQLFLLGTTLWRRVRFKSFNSKRSNLDPDR